MMERGAVADGVTVRSARADDWSAVEVLLLKCGLPTEGAFAHLSNFTVAARGSELVGVAGVEVHGEAGLLRSVAVSAGLRDHGLGTRLVDAAEAVAKTRGVTRLCLLTTTSVGYFARRGFKVQDRVDAPPALSKSEEFRGACPASATFMALDLGA